MRPGLRPPARAPLAAALVALLPLLAGCGGTAPPAASPTPQAAASGTPSSAPRRGGDVISEQEIREGGDFRDAYHIVERLRPQFLRSRGATNPYDRQGATTAPLVYLNNQKLGRIETLREIAAGTVREVRYLSAADAATRWGTSETAGGIIVVTTRAR